MLALFKNVAAQLLVSSSGIEEDDYSSWEAETTLTLNLGDVHRLVPTLPTWSGVAEACSRAAHPVYHAVKKTFTDDIDSLVHLLADLDPISPDDYDLEGSETSTIAQDSAPSLPVPLPTYSNSPLTFRKRRKMDPELDGVLVMLSSDPSIPTIIVTPCPDTPHDRSCLVPYQDASFGNRLAVPMHPVVNGAYPPLQPRPLPYVDHWCFKDGHWWAVLPTLEEQTKRNMFSRPISRRRRAYIESHKRPFRIRHAPYSARSH
ncbi:hypothetical protein BDY19DRAFT_22908 [Irpex rosettiformis]|uniref:Uncharacterized protein n=1 Tax=Irpex rosettiformis TaxID=378272 RepID=A0ACB8UJH5_9APHY|nr:hypothetical protein BDY19DRAFT_22908 [Irpex rosettiformis]